MSQTVAPLYRRHVFAQVKPTTRTRIDLGFAEIGDEVKQWLRTAFEEDR